MVQAPISYHTRQKDVAGPMLNETRDMLRKWFQQWNEELAHVLRDKGYLWNDVDIATWFMFVRVCVCVCVWERGEGR